MYANRENVLQIQKLFIGKFVTRVLKSIVIFHRKNFPSLFILIMVAGCSGVGGSETLNVESSDNAGLKTQSVAIVSNSAEITPPSWVLGKSHPSFPFDMFLTGVGVSESNAVSANASARSELASSIKVTIQSKMTDITTEEWNRIDEIITTEVKARLEGVEIRDGWYDPNKRVYYALAAIERDLLAAVFRDQIKSNDASLEHQMKEGIQAEKNGEIILALKHFVTGVRNSRSQMPLKSALRTVLRSTQPLTRSKPKLDPEKFLSRINRIVENLKLDAQSGDQQVVKTTQWQLAPLVSMIYFKNGDKITPAPNLPVIFEFKRGKGSLIRDRMSNSEGQVQTTVQEIHSFDEKVNTVTAKLDYAKILSHFEDPIQANHFLVPLKHIKTSFNFSINIQKYTDKPQGWNKGISDLVLQIIKNIPPSDNPKIGVFGFKDQRLDQVTDFSRLLKEDFMVFLVQAQNLTVREIENQDKTDPNLYKEIAQKNRLDFYVTGNYKMGVKGLNVKSKLLQTDTGNILSSGNIKIGKDSISKADIAMIQVASVENGFSENQSVPKGFEENLENLIDQKPESPIFKIQVWTDKKEYQVGENIVFYVKAERDCYLTLFNTSSSGNTSIIFPNSYHEGRSNFIRGGKTYKIPEKHYGFKFQVAGPSGLERIKAIATLTPGLPIDFDPGQGFHLIEKDTTRGTRDIVAIKNNLAQKNDSDWTEGYHEVFIFERSQVYERGTRKVPLIEKPKKPIDMIGRVGNEPKK
jgi:TolB-like protein